VALDGALIARVADVLSPPCRNRVDGVIVEVSPAGIELRAVRVICPENPFWLLRLIMSVIPDPAITETLEEPRVNPKSQATRVTVVELTRVSGLPLLSIVAYVPVTVTV
jgi:hypothetical protein